MSRVFPKNSREIAGRIMLGAGLVTAMAVAAIAYYVTPKYTRVGYAPRQPVAYSHELHAGTLGLDCIYCHTHVREAAAANVPTAQVCMNCHDQSRGGIKAQSGSLTPLVEAYKSGQAVEWVRVHKLPDFVYFDHSAHVNRGVGCISCHGRVDRMAVVRHEQPLSMSWCLDCHRDPAPRLRPAEEATNMAWTPPAGWDAAAVVKEKGIMPPVNCTGCHR